MIDPNEFEPILYALRNAKQYVSAAPTYVPTTLLDQFVLYKNGSTYRLYVWYGVTDGWHYIGLT